MTQKILIIDDSKLMCQNYRSILMSFGYEVGFLLSPEVILERLQEDIPDLILLDINMPKITGDMALKQLKAHAEFHDIPVIMLTSEDEQHLVERCFELGALDYIHKSSGELVLKARIKAALSTVAYEHELEERVKERTTELQKTTLAMIEAKEKAESMNRLKSNFLANITHELRTPLNGIIGLTTLQQMSCEETNDEEGIERSTEITNSAYRLLDTVNDILDLARIESEKLKLHLVEKDKYKLTPETINCVKECELLVGEYQSEAEKKNILLLYQVNQPALNLSIDLRVFSRIIKHLLNNALKFTSQGSITIEVSPIDEKVMIKIIDTGIGISPEFLPQIYDEFKQESTGFTRGYEGNGLGLTLTKNLVDLVNGKINVTSTKGDGTIVTVTF